MSDGGDGGGESGAGDFGSSTPAEVTEATAAPDVTTAPEVAAPEVVSETAPAPVAETVVVAMPMPAPAAAEPAIKGFLSRALEALQIGKRAKLDKILAEAKNKHAITNDGVEKLLRVSDATATRYLSQLVKEGKLKRSKVYSETVYEPI